MNARIGTAGWSIPKQNAAEFPGQDPALARYSRRLHCAEINSTFYRSHRLSTYERWAALVPEDFRFAVKVPKAITHECGLAPTASQFRTFLDEVGHLGSRLGPLLVQLPPKQGFREEVARRFFGSLREAYPEGLAALEPRHTEWFGPEAEAVLMEFRIARAGADPARVPDAGNHGGDPSLVYYRLHGSPRMYYSNYSDERLRALAATLAGCTRESEVWCIFDNTASGAALGDALHLQRLMP